MTCIVGFSHRGKVYIGGDSSANSDQDISERSDKKVFEKGGMIFGFCGSFRIGQVVQYAMTVPKQRKSQTDHGFLCTTFVDRYTQVLKENRCIPEFTTEECIASFLIGYRGTLYRLDSDFQIAIPASKFDAIGCGDSYALGALYILSHAPDTKPLEKLNLALEAAERFCSGVLSPFTFITK